MSQACKYKSLCNCLHFPRRIRTRRSLLIFPTHSCHFTRTALARLNDGSAPACIAAVISSHMYLPFWPHLDCASNTSEEKMNLKNVPSVHASLQFMVYNPLGFLSPRPPPNPSLAPPPSYRPNSSTASMVPVSTLFVCRPLCLRYWLLPSDNQRCFNVAVRSYLQMWMCFYSSINIRPKIRSYRHPESSTQFYIQ